MKYGLVLAGGGARGAYQIGVWKALREMKIEICAAAGTSVGAINAALIAQGEYETAQKLWKEMTIDKIVKLPEEMKFKKDLFGISNLKNTFNEMLRNNGLDMTPLEETVRLVIDEEKIRRSETELGITAFSVNEKREIYKFKEDIPNGKLADYLMASASLVGFKAKEINFERFMDGGISNNMPLNMLFEKGIDNIITVDVRGMGVYRSFNLAGKNVINIRFDNPHSGIMEFDGDKISKSMDDGYIGCMKAFGIAEGKHYGIWSESIHKARMRYSEEITNGIEAAAKIFDIDAGRIYAFEELKNLVMECYRQCVEKYSVKSMTFSDIKKAKDNIFTVWLVHFLETGDNDFVLKKIPLIGGKFDAASAILYFKKTQ